MNMLFLSTFLAVSAAAQTQKACTPNVLPHLKMAGYCVGTKELERATKENDRIEIAVSDHCASFDGSWCAYVPNSSPETKSTLLATCKPQLIYQNVALATDFMTRALGQQDISAFERYGYTSPDFINRNPNASSTQQLIDFVRGNTALGYEVGGVAGDCNMVIIYGRATGFGPRPRVSADIFRIANGRFTEHWDVLQDEVPVEQTAGRVPMFSRLPAFDYYCDPLRVRRNVALVVAFFSDVMINKNASAISGRYYAPNLVNHNPQAATVQDFAGFITATRDTLRYDRGGVVGDCNKVMVYGRYTGFPGFSNPVVGVDIFRVAGELLVEHWDVLQEEVPPGQTASRRPMYTTLPTLPV